MRELPAFLLPYRLIRVTGASMTPTLVEGDRVLVRYGASVRAGAVVLARFERRPDLLVVKRAVRPHPGGWWLASDNSRAGSASDELGVAVVEAVAVCYWPGAVHRGVATGPSLRSRRALRRLSGWRPRALPPPTGGL